MERVMVKLTDEEKKALWESAQIERRDFRKQAAWFIHESLERRGLLSAQRDARPVITDRAEASYAA